MPNGRLVQSLSRGLAILDLVARSENGMALRDIREAMGLKASTAHNLLRTMVAAGYLEKVTGPIRYRLGGAVLDLVHEHGDNALMKRASAVLPELYGQLRDILNLDPSVLGPHEQLNNSSPQSTDWTITLGRVVGAECTMVLRVSPERPTILERPSKVLHPYGSAVTLAFQAYWSQPERDAYRQRHPFWRLGEPRWGTEDNLDDFLAEVRHNGYSMPDIHGPEILRVAVPVFGPGHEIVAVLGAGRWKKSMSDQDKQKYIEIVKVAADRIGEQTSNIGEESAHTI